MTRARVLPAALFVVSFAIFLASPNHAMSDSGYALLVSENLVRHGDLDLARDDLERDHRPNYRLTHVGRHVFYYFPVASSVLSVPYLVVARLLGAPAIAPDGRYSRTAEETTQARLAALLMAAYAVIVFETARLLIPAGSSLAVALVTAFGTQVYSTTSRTLWSDDWALVLVGTAVYLLVRAAARGERQRPLWLGTLAAWAYFVRPTNAWAVAGLGAYLFFVERAAAWKFMAAAALWFGAFAIDSTARFGTMLPPYFRDRLTRPFAEALVGTLASPSRGLLVCVPATLAVAALALWHRHAIRRAPLAWLSVGMCLAHWLTISGFPHWWGGHCFGARLATGLVPWLALLAIVALEAAAGPEPGRAASRRRGAVAALAVVLSAASVAINAGGAISSQAAAWNVVPANVDVRPERLWSWRDAQIWAAFRREPPPAGPAERR